MGAELLEHDGHKHSQASITHPLALQEKGQAITSPIMGEQLKTISARSSDRRLDQSFPVKAIFIQFLETLRLVECSRVIGEKWREGGRPMQGGCHLLALSALPVPFRVRFVPRILGAKPGPTYLPYLTIPPSLHSLNLPTLMVSPLHSP